MIRYLFFISTLVLSFSMGAQEISRQVISPCANVMRSSAVTLNTVVGQIDYKVYRSDSLILTEGFVQPALPEFRIEHEILPPECDIPDRTRVQVTAVYGCSTEIVEYYWNGVRGIYISPPLEEGVHTLEVFQHSGCQAQMSIVISADDLVVDCEDETLHFYPVFTPNSDGENDFWIIDGMSNPNYSSNQVQLFNRWGMKVWEADNYNNIDVVWDGSSSGGKELPSGTYFYVLKIGEDQHKGYVELLR